MSLRIARGALVGVASGLLCLVLLVRLTLEVDVRLLTAEVLLPALVFFAAVAAGAVAGWRGRRGSARGPGRDVVLACGLTVGGLSALSSGLALTLGTAVENELAELSAILVGVVLGAWGQATLSEVLAAGDGQRAQTASEYLGLILVVSMIIAALSSLGPAITQLVRDTLDAVESGQGIQTGRGESAAAPQREEGKGAASSSAARGGASAPVVRPLTQENVGRPWERIGVSEEEWKQLEQAILDEVNPGGLEGFLTGAGAAGVTLDENGKLKVVLSRDMLFVKDGKLEAAELQENGAGGGLAKALLKLAGASGTKTLAKALTKLPPGLRERFARLGIVPGVKNPTAPGAAKTADVGGAKFAQKSFNENFSKGGIFRGQTIDDVASALKSGSLSATDVPINVVVRDGNTLILNTRSAQALTRAGVPRGSWKVVNKTGDDFLEGLLSGQLRRNGLGSGGTDLP